MKIMNNGSFNNTIKIINVLIFLNKMIYFHMKIKNKEKIYISPT